MFKLELGPLGRRRTAWAFGLFFAMPAPSALADIHNLTPGDFAVVSRQMRYRSARDAETILAALGMEAAAKPGHGARIGFGYRKE